jgi:hypothetical protein
LFSIAALERDIVKQEKVGAKFGQMLGFENVGYEWLPAGGDETINYQKTLQFLR